MNTFNYPIPARSFLENGGNIIKATILTECNPNATKHTVVTRDVNSLVISSGEGSFKTHLDLCWVLAEINR